MGLNLCANPNHGSKRKCQWPLTIRPEQMLEARKVPLPTVSLIPSLAVAASFEMHHPRLDKPVARLNERIVRDIAEGRPKILLPVKISDWVQAVAAESAGDSIRIRK